MEYKFSKKLFTHWIHLEKLYTESGYKIEGYSFLNNYYYGTLFHFNIENYTKSYVFLSLVSPFFIYFQERENSIQYPTTEAEINKAKDIKQKLLAVYPNYIELPLEYIDHRISTYINEGIAIKNELKIFDVLFGGMSLEDLEDDNLNEYRSVIQNNFRSWANAKISFDDLPG